MVLLVVNFLISPPKDIISFTKFDASVDLDIRMGVDPKNADQMVRGNVSLPHGTGKDIKVLALLKRVYF